MNRRQFIGQAAATLGASLISSTLAEAGTASPNDQIHLGIIGPGSRGQQLMRTMMRVPGVRFTGLCDIYEPRFAAARKITGEQTPMYRNYQDLLASKDIDAVLIATPLSLHSEHVIATLESGRHVYGEKTLALTV